MESVLIMMLGLVVAAGALTGFVALMIRLEERRTRPPR